MLRISVAPLCFAALAGCAATPPGAKAPEKCPTQHVTVSLLASPRVNPTRDGEARPVVVRVYQLRSDVRLANAPFEKVWHDDKATLGDDLVKADERTVYPRERADLSFDRVAGVDHVAALALFQSPQGRSWAASFELPPAPAPGACTTACDEDDDACDARAVAAPHLSFYLDANRIADGAEHLDEYPSAGALR